MLAIPPQIQAKYDELEELVNLYPLTMPVPIVAKFLSMDDASLRACIQCGNCPFGLGWKKPNKENSAFCIPTPLFYFWYKKYFA